MSEKPKEDEEKLGSWPELNFSFFGFQQLFINRYDIISVYQNRVQRPLLVVLLIAPPILHPN